MSFKKYKYLNQLLVMLCIIQGASFSEVRAAVPETNNIIWSDDFESGDMSGWNITNETEDGQPHWFIEKGYLIQDTDFGNSKSLLGTDIVAGSSEWGNYTLRTNMVCADDDYIGVLFRFVDVNNYYRLLISSQRKIICVEKKVNGDFTRLASYTEKEWPYVRFSATIALSGSNIKVFLNDSLFFDINDDQFHKGRIGFTSISNLGSFFDDVTIYSNYKVETPEVKQGICRGPYLQNVLEGHAVIMWDTFLPVGAEVEYGLNKSDTKSVADTVKETKHEIKIEDLQKETIYYYRVKSDTVVSQWYTFKTAVERSTPFSFLAYGDTQMNFLRHNELVKQFGKHEFNFLVNCGDVVQRGPRKDWDTEFFTPLHDILTGRPVYAAIGNHELNSENFYANFANPDSEHENYYSFKYGNSFFIFIDNPRTAYPDKEYYTDYQPGSAQYEWLESQLASDDAQDAEWLFVVSHVPSYVAGTLDNYEGCKKYLVPLFEKYHVDMSFSGHIHGYERGEVNGVTYVIAAGGGGPQNKPDEEGTKSYKDFKLVYNFCIIDIDGNKLTFKAFDKSNKLIDELELNH